MKVLFVCNGNVARSQEAAAYFNLLVDDPSWHASSAGINVKVGKPIDPLVIKVMEEDKVSIANAERKLITPEAVEAADLVISFKPQHELPSYCQKAKILRWDVPDPQHTDLEHHRTVRNTIKALVTDLIHTLSAESQPIEKHTNKESA